MRNLLTLLLLGLAMACGAPQELVPLDEPTGDRLGDSYLQGSLDDMSDIDAFASQYSLDGNRNWFNAISLFPNGNREAMSILSVHGGTFNNEEFEPGNTINFHSIHGNSESDLQVNLMGCLFNNESNAAYFDDQADEVEIFTELLDDNIKRVNYIGRWLDTNDNVTDEFFGFINIEVQ